jgi:hypothetical protein
MHPDYDLLLKEFDRYKQTSSQVMKNKFNPSKREYRNMQKKKKQIEAGKKQLDIYPHGGALLNSCSIL